MSLSHIRLVWGLHWFGMFVVMHIPKNNLPTIHVSGLDKQVHFVCYGVLALLCAWSALRGSVVLTGRWYAKWLLVFALYAVVDELLQGLAVVNRTPDVSDWVADMAGVVVVFGVVGFMRSRSVSGRR